MARDFINRDLNTSKLCFFLRLLQRAELEEFAWFITSPRNPHKAENRRFLEAFRKYVLKSPKPISKQTLWYLMTPDKPYHRNRMDQGMSRLLNQLIDFIVYRATRNNPLVSYGILLQDLNHRGVTRYFQQYFRNAKHVFARAGQDPNKIRLKVGLYQEFVEFMARTKDKGYSAAMRQVIEMMNTENALQRLMYTCSALDSRIGLDDFLMPEVLKYVLGKYSEMPLIVQFYYHAYRLRTQSRKKRQYHYAQCRSILFTKGPEFSRKERYDLFRSLRNACTNLIHQSDFRFKKAFADLHKHAVSQDLLPEDGISEAVYKSVVKNYAESGAIREARDFAQQNQSRLPPKSQQIALAYNMAVCAFYAGNYLQAIKGFASIPGVLADDTFALPTRTYEIKAYIHDALRDDAQYDAASGRINAFSQSLNRKKDASNPKWNAYRMFTKHCQAYVRAATEAPKQRTTQLLELRHTLENAGQEEWIIWLLGRVNHLLP